jgi:hypothetical protein
MGCKPLEADQCRTVEHGLLCSEGRGKKQLPTIEHTEHKKKVSMFSERVSIIWENIYEESSEKYSLKTDAIYKVLRIKFRRTVRYQICKRADNHSGYSKYNSIKQLDECVLLCSL